MDMHGNMSRIDDADSADGGGYRLRKEDNLEVISIKGTASPETGWPQHQSR